MIKLLKGLILKLQIFIRRKLNQYPASVSEVIDPKFVFKSQTIEAMKKFAQSKPWRGTDCEKMLKLAALNSDLSKIYRIRPPALCFTPNLTNMNALGVYDRNQNVIFLDENRISVITYLHEFGHALGKNEWDTCKWSINLFKRTFPKTFKNLESQGHVLSRSNKNIFGF